jgi:spermidine synthase
MILWGGIVSDAMRSIFITMFRMNPFLFLLPLLLVFLFFKRRSMVHVSIMAVGATEISCEVILIVLFQTFYGYLYGWIGAIIACYMLGLAVGTWFYLRSALIRGSAITMLSNVGLFMTLYCTVIVAMSFTRSPGVNIIIPVLVFLGGFLGGLHFPLSVKILRRRNAGVVYSIDMIGSSIGAFATAVIFIPILGIPFTMILFGTLNLLVAIGLRTIRQ